MGEGLGEGGKGEGEGEGDGRGDGEGGGGEGDGDGLHGERRRSTQEVSGRAVETWCDVAEQQEACSMPGDEKQAQFWQAAQCAHAATEQQQQQQLAWGAGRSAPASSSAGPRPPASAWPS